MLCGCDNTSNTDVKKIYKDREEVEIAAETYLKEKYGKEFDVAVADNPNHLYTSYALTAYALDDESKELFDMTVTYYDEETYSVRDNYFIYFIKDDLEDWFYDVADPYIDCDFKVFYLTDGALPNDFDECKTANDFLEVAKVNYSYGLRFYIVLPASEWDTEFNEITNSLAMEMQEMGIHSQISIIVYEGKKVYDQIITKRDERYFWTHSYRHRYCASTVRANLSLSLADEILSGGDSKYNDIMKPEK